MPFSIHKVIRATVFGCMCWAANLAIRADEELPAPAPAPAGELGLPDDEPAEVFTPLVRKPTAGSPLRLFEESPEVQEFARRLTEQLNAHRTGTASKLRSVGRGSWKPGERIRDACAGNCPICGSAVPGTDDLTFEQALGGRSRKPTPHRLFEEIDVGELPGGAESKGEAKLMPGEPAQVILELRERLGASALEGSEFKVKPDALAKLIRALDRESLQEEQDAYDRAPPSLDPLPEAPAVPAENHDAAISALRMASRQLDEAADVLEQQNLFERADQLRDQADQLRRDARAFLQEQVLPQAAPILFEQSSAPAAIEPRAMHAAAFEPNPGEFASFLQASRSKSARANSSTHETRAAVGCIELFLDELADIRQAIEEVVNPKQGSNFFMSFER